MPSSMRRVAIASSSSTLESAKPTWMRTQSPGADPARLLVEEADVRRCAEPLRRPPWRADSARRPLRGFARGSPGTCGLFSRGCSPRRNYHLVPIGANPPKTVGIWRLIRDQSHLQATRKSDRVARMTHRPPHPGGPGRERRRRGRRSEGRGPACVGRAPAAGRGPVRRRRPGDRRADRRRVRRAGARVRRGLGLPQPRAARAGRARPPRRTWATAPRSTRWRAGSRPAYLICERCGGRRALTDRELEPLRRSIRKRFGYEARFRHFPITGLCETCAARQKAG